MYGNVLFLRLQTLLGVQFTAECLQKIQQNFQGRYTVFSQNTSPYFLLYSLLCIQTEGRVLLAFPLSDADVAELFPVIKHIHRIFFEEGTALSKLAVMKNSNVLFDLASKKYQESGTKPQCNMSTLYGTFSYARFVLQFF
jgi:hypothetical protein